MPPHDEVPLPHDEVVPPHDEVPLPHDEVVPPHDKVPLPHDEVVPPHDEVPLPHIEVIPPHDEVVPPHDEQYTIDNFDTNPPPYQHNLLHTVGADGDKTTFMEPVLDVVATTTSILFALM